MPSDSNPETRPSQSYQRSKFANVTREEVKVYRETRFSLERGGLHVDRKEKVLVRRILERLGPLPVILDVPGGAGRYVELLRGTGSRLIETDLSLAMIQDNRAQWGRPAGDNRSCHMDYVLGDAEWLPMQSRSADMVFCLRLFHHVDASRLRINIMREFCRVTREWVVLSFYHYYCYRHLKKVIRNKPHRGVYLPFAAFRKEAEEAGLRVVDTYPVARFMHPQWIVLLRRGAPGRQEGVTGVGETGSSAGRGAP